MVDEPQPVLGERQWDDGRPLDRHQRLAPRRAIADPRRELSHGGGLEDGPHRQLCVERRVDPGDQPHGGQRVSTQVEERVVNTDPLDTEKFGVDGRQGFLDRARRGPVPRGVLVVRSRQRPGVQLAVDGDRQRRHADDGGRDHVARQPVRQRGARLGRVCRADDVTDQALVAGTVFAGDHRRVLDAGQLGQCRTDIAQFDAVAADLDLLVGAAEVVQLPIGAPRHQISGAVHAGARFTERAGHETCCGQARSAPVADTDAAPGEVQLADHARRDGAQRLVEHEERRTRSGRTDRWCAGARGQGQALAQPHGRLGRPVDVDHRAARCPAVDHLGRAGLGADDQSGRVQALGGQHRCGRGRLGQYRDSLANQQVVEVVSGAGHGVGHHHEPSAVQQRAPDLPHREVERIGVELRPHLFRRQLDADLQALEQLHDVVLGDRNAFGHTGGARGVDQVSHVIGRGPVRRCARLRRHRSVGHVDDRDAESVEPVRQIAGGHDGDRCCVAEHELDAGRRQCRIERQICRAGLEHRQDCDDRFSGA